MSVQQSDITDLGYDLVVGVSQTGLNAVLKNYYQNSQEYFLETTAYFMNGGASVDWNYMSQKLGVDPFSIDSWNGQGTMPADIQACVNGGFDCAFKFIPGDPGDASIPTYPAWDYTYLTYEAEMSQYGPIVYNYTLCCSDIQVVYWDPFANVWVNYTQSSVTGSPITDIVKFCAYANLGTSPRTYNPSDYTLPADVKAQAAAYQSQGVSFSIQQLLFELDNLECSTLTTLPFMTTLNEFYYQRLGPCFQQAYAQALKGSFKNQPVLCFALSQTNQSDQSVLNPTNVQMYMEKLVDANGNVISDPTAAQTILNSLNYICAINGSTPVPAKQFNWNWFDKNQDINGNSSFDGAIAVSKYALGRAFYAQLQDYVQNNCWVPQIQCTNNNGTDAWSFSMTGAGALNADPVMKNNSDNYFLIYYYEPQPFTTYGVVNPKDYVTVTTGFQMEVFIKDPQTITVTQESTFTYVISLNGEEAIPGTLLSLSYSEDYAVSVLATGELVFTAGTPTISRQQGLIPYLTDAESVQLQTAITNTEKNLQSAGLTAEPLGSTQQVIFPGGNVFAFFDMQFTATNDLACKINYQKTSA